MTNETTNDPKSGPRVPAERPDPEAAARDPGAGAEDRPGFDLGASHLPEGSVSLVEVPALAISSSDCRARVGRGMPVWYLVPDGVVQYIEKRGLYRSAAGGRAIAREGIAHRGGPATEAGAGGGRVPRR